MSENYAPAIAAALAAQRHGRFQVDAQHDRRLAQLDRRYGVKIAVTRFIGAVRISAMTGAARVKSWSASRQLQLWSLVRE